MSLVAGHGLSLGSCKILLRNKEKTISSRCAGVVEYAARRRW